jgi:catechol 2,3-dioxygenase-like lactoylglutathione lyase family enzyme
MMTPGILRLSHVALRASDVERSVAFYRDVLGFAEASRLRYGDGALMLVNMRVSETQWIELFDASRLPPGGDQIHQIAFAVEDGERLREFFDSHGQHVPDRCPKGQMGNAYFIVRDPNGYDLEFVHYLSDAWPLRDPTGHLSPLRISQRIADIGLVLRDPKASHEFYRQELGLIENAGGRWTIANGEILLRPAIGKDEGPRFALEVEKLDEAITQIEASGGTVIVRGRVSAEIVDPEGITVELVAK